MFERRRQNVVKRTMVEQRKAAGQHDHVRGGFAQESREHRGLVHPGADRADDPLVAKLRESGHGLVSSLLPVLVGIMHVNDVEAIRAIYAGGVDGLEAIMRRGGAC